MVYAAEMLGITKCFGKLMANNKVTLQVKKQEVHCLLGENGAGKSTLMNVFTGLYQPTSGEIKINGQNVVMSSPQEAWKYGIGMVHQHFMLVERMTAIENIMLGFENTRCILREDAHRDKILELSDKYRLKVKLEEKIENLSVGNKQRVEILKTLYRGAQIVILDEPTSVLAPSEVEGLYEIMQALKADGKSIIFITHKLNETMHIADRITVLRNSCNIATLDKKDTNPQQLANLMVGEQVSFNAKVTRNYSQEPCLLLEDVQLMNKAVEPINLQVHKGEIFGIAGVEGNGQTELEEIIMGLKKLPAGRIIYLGKDISRASVKERKKMGIAHIPSDRYKRAMLQGFSILENILLGQQHNERNNNKGWLNRKELAKEAQAIIKDFAVKATSVEQTMGSLSGGNQQKVILGREVNIDPELVIAAQPTRGLDIGATNYIHNLLVKLRDNGKAILLISADLQELRKLSDRIAVLYEGLLMGVKRNEYFSDAELGLMIAGKRGENSA